MSFNNNLIIPTQSEMVVLKDLGSMLVKSGLLPSSIKTPEQALVIMLKGKELGIPPMQAFSSISVVQGKPTIGAELMLALVYKNCPGSVVDFIETSSTNCVIQASRPGGKSSKFSFSIEDAKKANLLGKSSWSQYPAAMLRARCISAMCRAIFPDALIGASHTPEELGAEVAEDGEVIEVESSLTQAPQVVTPKQLDPQVATTDPNTSMWSPGVNERKELDAIVQSGRWSWEQITQYLDDRFKVQRVSLLDASQYGQLKQTMEMTTGEAALYGSVK